MSSVFSLRNEQRPCEVTSQTGRFVASAASSALELTSAYANTWITCVDTVRREMKRRLAIRGFERPSSTKIFSI